MDIIIRPETVYDYNRIAVLTEEAFEINFLDGDKPASHIGEISLVDHLRHWEYHDPELALVAEIEGELVGHILFTPYRVGLYGRSLFPVCLSILSVAPRFQRTGIGSALVRAGLDSATKKGHPFSYLYGHDTYYPKFGYRTNMFGTAGIEVNGADYPAQPFSERVPEAHMLSSLIDMHTRSFDGVPLAIEASRQMMEWKSWTPFVTTSALYEGDRLFAYIRYVKNSQGLSVKKLVAAGSRDVAMAVRHLFSLVPNTEKLSIPLYPSSPVLEGLSFVPSNGVWSAGMLLVLDDGCAEINRYCSEVIQDPDTPGMPGFPIFFDWL